MKATVLLENFQRIPEKYALMLENMDNYLSKIYEQFTFQYFKFDIKTKEEEIAKYFSNFLKHFKFITYQIQKMPEWVDDISSESDLPNEQKSLIICIESNCIIIESIKFDLITSILGQINSPKIDVNLNPEINEEILVFYEEYKKGIDENKFIKYTYKPIIAYIIQRNYYPSNFFIDNSFFSFNNYLKTNPQIYKSNNDNKLIKFDEKDFINLKLIYSSGDNQMNLLFHKESFCLLVTKNDHQKNEKYFNRQFNFFTHHSHRCIVKCYGYIKSERYYGFIYDFMCNGSLCAFNEKNHEKYDFFYSFMSMNRILQSIEYLHSNSFIHRDIKPSNILINNDHLPFLADFDTVRSIDLETENEDEMTFDFASPIYSSPEQRDHKKEEKRQVNCSTDVYSFGCLIYYLFEKKDMNEQQFSVTEPAIQQLIINCTKNAEDERPKIEEIKEIIIEQIQSCFYLKPKFLKEKINDKSKNYIDLFLNENIILISKKIQDNDETCLELNNLFSTLIKENDTRDFLYRLGRKYLSNRSKYSEQKRFTKARKIFEISSKLGHSQSYLELASFYLYGYGVQKDPNKAKEYFEKSKELGSSDGLVNLGILYLKGLGVKKDIPEALKLFQESAKKENTLALIYLGNIYLNGIYVNHDFDLAYNYYKQAADSGNSEGYIGLASLYRRGLGVKKDLLKAEEYYKEAAKLKNLHSYQTLANLYTRAFKQYDKAKEYLEKGAECSETNAMIQIGNLYFNGFGVKRDFKEAKKWYQKAADMNNSSALIGLGFLYLMGLGVEQDYQKAKEYFELSAYRNNASAFIYLGQLYLEGKGVERDRSKTKEYYKKTGELNHYNRFVFLGEIYYYGIDTAKDYPRALSNFQKSCKTNNTIANIYIGDYYLYIEKNPQLAIKHYEEASSWFNMIAQFKLGKLYLEGTKDNIITPNYNLSKKYFEESATSNYPDAFYYLGKIYYEGLGVEQNYKRAREYFEYSALYSNKKALYYLGRIFENGEGMSASLSEAIGYYSRCAESHDEIFVYYNQREWTNETRINRYYYCSNNILGSIYLTEKEFQDKENIEKCVNNLNIAALNEYPHGQNNLGIYYEFWVNDIDKAKYFYSRASDNSFALSEFNKGRLVEFNDKNSDCFDLYDKVIEHEKQPFIFQNYLYYDERLEISKSFIICYINLKFYLREYKKTQFKSAPIYLINALFKPIFKFLLNNKIKSHLFQLIIYKNKDHQTKTNLRDFILTFPLFESVNQAVPQKSWRMIDSNNDAQSKSIIIQFDFSKENNQKNNKTKMKINDELNDNDDVLPENLKFDEFRKELIKILNYYGDTEKKYKIKENANENNSNNMREFTFTKCDNNNEIKIQYSTSLVDLIFDCNHGIVNEITDIVKEMTQILFTPPYYVLLGRIKLPGSEISLSKKGQDINENFYDGLEC